MPLSGGPSPAPDCDLCPRLAAFRADNRAKFDGWHNAPVPSFGPADAPFLIVGLAPGLRGANRTGRPFTGDHAGDLLYRTLAKFDFASGAYGQRADDGLRLIGCRITNAVRCVPPENKPIGAEVKACRPFLNGELIGAGDRRIILALGGLAHGAVLAGLGLRKASYPFGHGHRHQLGTGPILFDSYHCSRYNTNTGRLTEAMFDAVFTAIRAELPA